jgi:hypothetical protein
MRLVQSVHQQQRQRLEHQSQQRSTQRGVHERCQWPEPAHGFVFGLLSRQAAAVQFGRCRV